MHGYAPPKEGRVGLRLDFNENTTGCSPAVLAALRAAGAEDLARYPEYAQGEAEIAAAFGHTPASFTLTNGVDDALMLAVLTFLDPGDELLIAAPTFAMYRFYAEQLGAVVRSVPARNLAVAPGIHRFELDLATLRAAITPRTRLICLASPNNPTGALQPPEALLELARDFPDLALLVDEAYAEFVADDYRGLLAAVLDQPNLLVARTFSKAYGMAGARLGCLAAHPALMPTLRTAHSPYNVNSLAVLCGRAAVRDTAWVADYRRQTIASRALVETCLQSLAIPYWQSRANFVLFDAGGAAAALVAACKQRGVLLRDRRADYPGAVRITCGTVEQTTQALRLLKELWPTLDQAAQPQPVPAPLLPHPSSPLARPWLVFDLDGVLVDVSQSYRQAILDTVRHLGGGDLSPADVQALKDEGGFNNDWDLSSELLRRRNRSVPYAEVVRVFNQFYLGPDWNGLILREQWLLPPDLLRELQRHYRLAIFTGRPRADAEFVLRRFHVAADFTRLLAMEDVTPGKPAPDGLLLLAREFAPVPIVAYVGDTVDDARCAAGAAVPFVGILPANHLSTRRLRQLFVELGSRSIVPDAAAAARALLQDVPS